MCTIRLERITNSCPSLFTVGMATDKADSGSLSPDSHRQFEQQWSLRLSTLLARLVKERVKVVESQQGDKLIGLSLAHHRAGAKGIVAPVSSPLFRSLVINSTMM
jgi:hypothetical protein